MIKRIFSIILIIMLCAGLFSFEASAQAKFPMDHIYVDKGNEKITNGNGKIYFPQTYSVTDVYSYVNDENSQEFSYPDDIFIDKEDNIFIADTGNDRIVKLLSNGQTDKVYESASGEFFSKPRGVFVDDSGFIYVADSGNNRIVKMTQQGELVDSFKKPDSQLLSDMEDGNFIPTKVAVGPTGYIYTLVGKDFMSIDSNHQFRGYIGATNLDFSLGYVLLDAFLTDKQMEKIDKRTPPSYNNFSIDSDGHFLACTNANKDQIRMINVLGNNIYASGFYGEILSISNEKSDYVRPYFIDLTSDANGTISALDSNSGYIYQYDKDGNILTVFGGMGNNMGYFEQPVSIACDSNGAIYVVDAMRKNIQKFVSTEFMQKIHNASLAYYRGDYDTSLNLWKDVISVCADYPLARRKIGYIYDKKEMYKEAMEEYSLGGDMQGYSDAFANYRKEFIKDHFVLTAVCVIGAISVLLLLIVYGKKYALRVRNRVYEERRKN